MACHRTRECSHVERPRSSRTLYRIPLISVLLPFVPCIGWRWRRNCSVYVSRVNDVGPRIAAAISALAIRPVEGFSGDASTPQLLERFLFGHNVSGRPDRIGL